jgi:chemotaxis protein CheC
MKNTDLLSEIETDAVAELMNMAMGQAAAALNELVHEEVRLSVPAVSFMSPAEFRDTIGNVTPDKVSLIDQHVSGPFDGDMLLIFPEENSLELVRTMLGEEIGIEELTELEQDAFIEIGNIIIGAAMATLANTLGIEFTSTLPTYARKHPDELLSAGAGPTVPDDSTVLFIHIEFGLPKREITGYLSFVMNAGSAEKFKTVIEGFVGLVSG